MDERKEPQLPSVFRPFAEWILDQIDRAFRQRGIGTRYIPGGTVRGDTNAVARVGVRKNSGATTYQRRRLNLIEGSNTTITVADDAVDEEVDITLAGTTGPHDILSTTHTDTDASDIPAEGDVLVWRSGQWVAEAPSTVAPTNILTDDSGNVLLDDSGSFLSGG